MLWRRFDDIISFEAPGFLIIRNAVVVALLLVVLVIAVLRWS
jgi:hypothetical protein